MVNENEKVINDDLDCTEILTWLHHNSIPYEEVAEKWRKSTALRLQFKVDETISEYYKKYPALNLQTGYLLVSYSNDNYQHCPFTKFFLA